MISAEKIESIAGEHLKGGPLFLTGVRVGTGNAITVFIDGDEGVKIADCVALSRFIESQLDRDSEDFSLDVSSHGASSPLVFPRQYRRHIGKDLEVRLIEGGKAEGELFEVDPEGISLRYSVRENKPLGKGKITVTKESRINYNQIKESKIKLKF